LQDLIEKFIEYLGSTADPLEALSSFELGMGNYNISEDPKGGLLVLVKKCPFEMFLTKVGPWSEEAKNMVQSFNKRVRGGAALHPFCVAHLSVRETYGAVNLGCRNTKTGEIAVSASDLLNEVSITAENVRELLEGNACLYWLK
jgi:hypothetical protein